MKNKDMSAFSLVELMVVVIILGVLVSMSLVGYNDRKKRGEYNLAVAQVRAIAAAQKDFFLTIGNYASTATTAATNVALKISVTDGYFRNYRTTSGAGAFIVYVDSGSGGSTATYTFNKMGGFVSCVGADCI